MMTATLQRDRGWRVASLPVAILFWYSWQIPLTAGPSVARPLRPLGVSCAAVRAGLEQRLILASDPSGSAAEEGPINLGHLQPRGRVNPDGSEVWGYPDGSGLEEVIEVHVKDGRVVREVLRQSSSSSAHLVAGVLSGEEGGYAAQVSGDR